MFLSCFSSVSNMINTKLFTHFQFCVTRKGVQQAASILVKNAKFIMTVEQKQLYFFFFFFGGRTFRDHLTDKPGLVL